MHAAPSAAGSSSTVAAASFIRTVTGLVAACACAEVRHSAAWGAWQAAHWAAVG
jgi:hypothetical protein